MDWFKRLGSSDFWVGESSIFGTAIDTIIGADGEISIGGLTIGGRGSDTDITKIATYAILGASAYFLIKK
jgi:hypothetical protein